MPRIKKNMTEEEKQRKEAEKKEAARKRADYNNAYQREVLQRFNFKLNRNTDPMELFDIWNRIEHKTAFLRSAIVTLGELWIREYDSDCVEGETRILVDLKDDE